MQDLWLQLNGSIRAEGESTQGGKGTIDKETREPTSPSWLLAEGGPQSGSLCHLHLFMVSHTPKWAAAVFPAGLHLLALLPTDRMILAEWLRGHCVLSLPTCNRGILREFTSEHSCVQDLRSDVHTKALSIPRWLTEFL